MTDDEPTDANPTVKLTPGKPAAKPKLAPVSTGPKSVVVSVPTAVPVATPAAPVAKPVAAVVDADAGPVKKGALLDEVVARSGLKRSDAKAAMEALLAVIGEEIMAENDIQLPPMGKLKVIKIKEVGRGASAVTLKLRTPNTQTD